MNPAKINKISVALLALGLGGALAIYLTAQPDVLDPLLGNPLGTKKYVHELRELGGRGNVLSAEFIDWFSGLWHGPRLGETVAVLTVLATLAFRFVAARPDLYAADPPPDRGPSTGGS